MKGWQIPTSSTRIKLRHTAVRSRCSNANAGARLTHRQIKYRKNVIECDHGKLKRIIGATPGFKSMKTACLTIKGSEVMRELQKGQAEAFYFGPFSGRDASDEKSL
ncbi:DDE-type integrase/transposase/recombinase [Raoultella ornithinolytica]|uniref:DDE-type integrase/transposase/recombinase n=1 Tax=Raoultella ornithinolytica TaxID=54291 RepID=UPI00224BA877|nr:DDE-type integrase/transposase/recombinase [Raoultella ornithinolytica]